MIPGLVSVIIPSYNRYELLLRAIRSVQQQTYQNIEIIVVNDQSTDPRYASISTLPNTHVIHLPMNQRKLYNTDAANGKTRQHGLNIARGEWIAFLDDDDYWIPQKLQIQLDALSQSPECKISSTNMIVVNLNNTITHDLYHKHQLNNILTRKDILETNWINTSSVLIHHSICEKVGEFILGNKEDYDYWLKALEHTQCRYIHQPLVYYTLDSTHTKYYR